VFPEGKTNLPVTPPMKPRGFGRERESGRDRGFGHDRRR
jgi:hypothetical protein